MITRTSRHCRHHRRQLQHPFFDVAPYHSCHDRDLLCKEEKLLRGCKAKCQSHKSTLAMLRGHASKASPSQTYQQFRRKHHKPVYSFAVYKELIPSLSFPSFLTIMIIPNYFVNKISLTTDFIINLILLYFMFFAF